MTLTNEYPNAKRKLACCMAQNIAIYILVKLSIKWQNQTQSIYMHTFSLSYERKKKTMIQIDTQTKKKYLLVYMNKSNRK